MILDGFPGKLEQKKIQGVTTTYLPTPEQEAWILQKYADPDVFTGDIAETIGTSYHFVHRFCHKHGLHHDHGLMISKSRQQQKHHKEKKDEVINAQTFVPDKQLLMLHSEDVEQPTIGHCVGESCINYHTEGCYYQVKNPATGRYQRLHRTECNAVF